MDVLTLTNPVFRKVYGESYLDLVNKAPHVLGFFYDMMDKPRAAAIQARQAAADRREAQSRQIRAICSNAEPWDVIVNTHFLPAEIIASLRRDEEASMPQITVTTDFETHRLWVNQPCDHYTTATRGGRRLSAALGRAGAQ